jgi:hypothetical protein
MRRGLLTGILDSLSEVSLSGLLHLEENHGRNFFRGEFLGFPSVLNRNDRFAGLGDDLEWPVCEYVAKYV